MSAPLGYVFWHWPRPRVGLRKYERKLLTFHDSLTANRPDGMIDVLSFRVRGLPWTTRGPRSCEDWYVVRDFGALGALNEAAVSLANREAHDAVAKDASGSAGGLYRLRRRGPGLGEARFATWVEKPALTTYQAFLEDLQRLAGGRKTDLWQRQMALGPAPEFCIHSEGRLDLPRGWRPRTVRLELVGARGGRPARTDRKRLENS